MARELVIKDEISPRHGHRDQNQSQSQSQSNRNMSGNGVGSEEMRRDSMSASSAGAFNRQRAATQSSPSLHHQTPLPSPSSSPLLSRSRQNISVPATPVTGQGQRVGGGNNGTTPFNSQLTSTMYDVSNKSSVDRPASGMVVREATVDQGGRESGSV